VRKFGGLKETILGGEGLVTEITGSWEGLYPDEEPAGIHGVALAVDRASGEVEIAIIRSAGLNCRKECCW